MRSHRSGADGVVGIAELFRNAFLEEVPFWTTPSAPLKEASRLLLDVASTPPMSGGELPHERMRQVNRVTCVGQQPLKPRLHYCPGIDPPADGRFKPSPQSGGGS